MSLASGGVVGHGLLQWLSRLQALNFVLANAAADAGAELRTATTVTGLLMDGDRVVGVTTSTESLQAPLVVGADGSRSVVARLVGAREYQSTPNGRIFMWAYYAADPTNGEMWIGKVGDHTYLSLPTDGGLTLIGVCPSIERRAEVRADREAVYEAGLRAWPKLHAGVGGVRPTGPVRSMAKMRGFLRSSAGPGWVLVGDAGHFKDPTPSQGIADALRQSEKLAAAITRSSTTATAVSIRPYESGGAGVTRTRGRCTGSPTTWELPGRPRRCNARPNGGSPRTLS